jgi:hypothetical protein
LCKDREIAIVDLFNPTMKECTKSDDDDDDDKEIPMWTIGILNLASTSIQEVGSVHKSTTMECEATWKKCTIICCGDVELELES